MVADKLSRLGQTIQTEWSLLPDIFQATCDRWHQPQINLFATRFTSTRPPGLGSGRCQPTMGGSGPLCISPRCNLRQSGGKVTGQPMQQNHSDCPGLAKHALVLGPGDHVQPNPTELAPPVQSAHPAVQPDSSHESVKLKSACSGSKN